MKRKKKDGKKVMKNMPLYIYVAGLFSTPELSSNNNADNFLSCMNNIRKGIDTAKQVIEMGHVPFTPWLDFLYHLVPTKCNLTKEQYYNISMRWLDKLIVQ